MMEHRYLFRACVKALILGTALSACATTKPQSGSLKFLKQQQQQELARSCYQTLTRNPWKKTYYYVGGALVNEKTYCHLKAQQAVQAIALRR
jgi:hypothetical protein